MNLLSRLLIKLIERYQSSGGGRRFFKVACNFAPSCSEYTRQAVKNFGLLPGIKLGIERIRRCNEKDSIFNIDDPIPLEIKKGSQKKGQISTLEKG
jgi:putative component of membrane protein insertase Oxa1/YidC/SpoIIIJ protein YidD